MFHRLYHLIHFFPPSEINSEKGPNICGGESTFRLGAPLECVVDSTVCGTARSSVDLSLTFDWFCPGDSPDGASINTAGQACYDTLADCVAGPNACSPAGTSCDFAPFICSTGVAAGTPNGYVCPLDLPVGATYSFSTGALRRLFSGPPSSASRHVNLRGCNS
jgi:hypothetical protein